MRIGIYTPYLDTLAGGEKYILTAAECLAKTHDVSIFWDKSEEHTLKTAVHKKFNLQIGHIPFVENIFTKKISFLSRMKQSKSYDYIIVLSDGSIPVVSSKLILHFQTPMPWIHPTIQQRVKLTRVSDIVCNSQFTKTYIDKEFGVKSVVIYPPVSVENTKDKKEQVILHVGRYGVSNQGSSAKKQEFMEEAFKKMVDNGLTNWKLVFVISYKKEVENEVEAFKKRIAGYPIEIVENPSNEVLWQMYNMAKIYWHASGVGEDLTKYPGRAEHFGIATVEAMGVGAVPVVIHAGGQPEIVHEGINGLLWNNENELIEKTKRIMNDISLWEELSSQAEKTAVNFCKERFCEEWSKIII